MLAFSGDKIRKTSPFLTVSADIAISGVRSCRSFALALYGGVDLNYNAIYSPVWLRLPGANLLQGGFCFKSFRLAISGVVIIPDLASLFSGCAARVISFFIAVPAAGIIATLRGGYDEA
jgi:hypothetical protein